MGQVLIELQVQPGVYQRVFVDSGAVDTWRESGWSLAQGSGPVISQLLPYIKPQTGIPATDLDAAVQTALMKAATAVTSAALTAAMLQVKTDIQAGVGVSLDTLAELAAALNNDPNFATTIATLMAGKAALLDTASTVTTAGALVVAKVNPVDATAGTVAMTLPTPASKGLMLSIEKADSSANTVTVTGTIRGASATITLSLFREAVLFVSDAAGSWRPLSDHKTLSSLDARFLKQTDAAATYAPQSGAGSPAAALTSAQSYTDTAVGTRAPASGAGSPGAALTSAQGYADTAMATRAPAAVFTRTYVPTNTTADRAGLQAVVDAWSASGLPGLIRIAAGVLNMAEPAGATAFPGAIRLPANAQPVIIEGAGEGTRVVLSRSVPRFLDLYSTGTDETFAHISARDFVVDGGAVNHTAIASGTTVSADVTLPAATLTAVTVADNSSFKGTAATYLASPLANTGTAAGQRFAFTLPGSGTTTINVYNSGASSVTLKTGDSLTGYLYDHVVLGNVSVRQTSGVTPTMRNITVERVRAFNIATTPVNGLNTFSPCVRFGINLTASTGRSVTGIRMRRVSLSGGDCGIYVMGATGSLVDDIEMDDCSHDAGATPTMLWPCANFLIGQNAWVGTVRLRNLRGKNSGDVGLEVDQAMTLIATNLQMDEAFSANYYITNFVPPAGSLAGPPTASISTGITNTDTTVTVGALPAGVALDGFVRIDSEVCGYARASATTLSLRRASDGTAAAAHGAGSVITFLEAEKQVYSFVGCTFTNTVTPGWGWQYNPNQSLPLPAVDLLKCSGRVTVADFAASHCVAASGNVRAVNIDNCSFIAILNNAAESAAKTYSAIDIVRPGVPNATTSGTGKPVAVRVRSTKVTLQGVAPSNGVQVKGFMLEDGWWIPNVQIEIRNDVVGLANGASAGVAVGGGTAACQLYNGGVIDVRYESSNTSDQFANIFLLSRSMAMVGALDLYVDNSNAANGGSQLPWNIASSYRQQVLIKRFVGPNLSANISARQRRNIVAGSGAIAALHTDEVIAVTTTSAAATVTLPVTNSGNANAIPRPGAGTQLTIKDASGNAATNNITINPASGETIDGASSLVVNTAYGKVSLLSTGTGWMVV